MNAEQANLFLIFFDYFADKLIELLNKYICIVNLYKKLLFSNLLKFLTCSSITMRQL